MGNEISTISGGAVTVGAAILAGATLGRVQSLNNAVVHSAAFTADKAKKTVVRHVGEATVMATATVGAGLASTITLGQVQALNDATVNCASQTAQASYSAGAEVVSIADGVTNSIPVVGHVKGAVLYAVGSSEPGERAMKGATRSVGVITGGIGGLFVGSLPGAVAGGVVGGALMGRIITGAVTSPDTVRGKDIPIDAEYLDALASRTKHAGAAWTKWSPKRTRGIVVIGYKTRTFHANPNFVPPMPGAPVADGVVVLKVRREDLPSLSAEARCV